ncbi:mandelate racemase/muconate lactonizing enzyme family protein [Peribacillus muralis]|uniref:mandelate racemase/muconate lactonizing enzyme family protein n=1 Tax=Peribacillus muralis TaxID=264697 RepID=UPI001F4EC829|nr:mandelate racemase/muconate lactonizing enzyme family protein [Peribacillus muralis]MCK1992930.1 mandelate racemase/muconate lactonizing enzyme family protein [Peribacillus muralis]MCK2013485.1 mandelate racemase/muconate lactonizing enzyme family protein [Peribacillus muralis]
MKITNVEAIYLKVPNLDAAKCDGTQDTLLIRIDTDEGITGYGEVDSSPLVAKAVVEAPASHSIAVGLKELLIGENPFEIERLWEKMFQGTIYFGRSGPALHAISGVDIALWDIIGKASNRSVSEAMGGVFRRKIKAYASSLMPDTVKEAGMLAERYAKLGYKAIKFGWGPIGKSAKHDEELVKTIREAIGDDIELMIDAGLVWDLKGAIQMANVFEKYGIFWLEEPLDAADLDGYRKLSERTSLYIAGGEQESGRLQFQRLLDSGDIDIIQPDLARCGGLTEAKKIAYMAYDRKKRIVPHAFKTGVLVAASTHFVASIPNGFMIEHTVSTSPLARDLVESPLLFKDGYIHLPETCKGLGISINKSVLDQYRVQ